MKYDLQAMYRSPAGQKRIDIIGALRERGYVLARQGRHEIRSNGQGAVVPVPRTLKGTGTIRSIVRVMIEAEGGEAVDG